MLRSLDDLRALRPDLGFALYAMTPKGTVTLEIHDENENVFTFKDVSEAAVIDAAFPEPAPVAPPASPPTMADFKPPSNVFD